MRDDLVNIASKHNHLRRLWHSETLNFFTHMMNSDSTQHLASPVHAVTDSLFFSVPPQSEQISHLVKIPGIVIAASSIRAKATRMTLQCRSCRNFINDVPLKPGLEGYALPRKCNT